MYVQPVVPIRLAITSYATASQIVSQFSGRMI